MGIYNKLLEQTIVKLVTTELDLFNSLIRARDIYTAKYLTANKQHYHLKTLESEALMNKYSKKLTKIEQSIENLKDKGYVDPADYV